jgi:hypothetical protein
MTDILRKIGTAWSWVWGHLPLIALIVFSGLWFWGDYLKVAKQVDNKAEAFECSTLCFPQQPELIVKQEASSCWCYVDNDTIVRSIYKTNQ